jgi:capsular polysaccharide biosynthesis protein
LTAGSSRGGFAVGAGSASSTGEFDAPVTAGQAVRTAERQSTDIVIGEQRAGGDRTGGDRVPGDRPLQGGSRRPPSGTGAQRHSLVPTVLLAVLVVLVATAAAWWTGSRGPTVYGAEAELLLDVNTDSDQAAERRLGTQMLVIEGGNVLVPASERLGMPLRELRRALDVSVVQGSQIIRLEASADSRERAVEIIDQVIGAYLAQPPDAVAQQTNEYLDAQIEQIAERRTEVSAELDRLDADDARAAELRAVADQLLQRESALQDQIVQIEVDQIQLGRPAITTPPSPIEDPLAPTPLRSAALGLLAGLVLASLVVVGSLRRRSPPDRT